jgi:hypothetical protein
LPYPDITFAWYTGGIVTSRGEAEMMGDKPTALPLVLPQIPY